MAETESGQSEAQETPAVTPPVSLTVEEIRAMVTAETDARIPGIQSAYEKQLAQLRKELKAAKADPDGYTSNASSELEAELAQARRDVDSLRAGRQFPDAYPLFEAMMAAGSAEEQMEILQQAVRPVATPTPAAPQAPAPTEQPASAPVDLNNPFGGPPIDASGMDDATADTILGQFNRWPSFNR